MEEVVLFECSNYFLRVPKSAIFQNRIAITLKLSQKLEVPCYSSSQDKSPKYLLTLIDSPNKNQLKQKSFGVFIIPQGQERSWSFSRLEGQLELLEMADTSRLLLVALGHGFMFSDLDSIKEDLNQVALALMPPGCKTSKIPFMTNGQIGEKVVIYFSDYIIIEDVLEDEVYHRQLLFAGNTNLVQSEIRIKETDNPENPVYSEGSPALKQCNFLEPDFSYLPFEVMRAQLLTFAFSLDSILNSALSKVLVFGSAGCVLPMFLHKSFSNAVVTAVDIDPVLVNLAEAYFGAKQSETMNIVIEDAMDYIDKAETQDYIIFDISDANQVLTPPPQFMNVEYLFKLKQKLNEGGVLSINIIGTESEISSMVACARQVFRFVYKTRCQVDTNQVMFCLDTEKPIKQVEKDLEVLKHGKKWDSTMNLEGYASGLKLTESENPAAAILPKKKNKRRKKR